MKDSKLLFSICLLFVGLATKAQVGIGTNNPATSAQLEVSSTSKGFLPPRMTEAQKNAITSPVDGLIVYQTDGFIGFYCYSSNYWQKLDLGAIGDLKGDMMYFNGTTWVKLPAGTNGQTLTFYNGEPVWKGTFSYSNTVIGTGGKIWMDRNLGATQVATSSTDAAAYGDLYQWGRGADGHQIRTSATTTVLSATDVPSHGNFITPTNNGTDWLSGHQNVFLWQGVIGANNPCPTGFRIPTSAEWDSERLSWTNSNTAGAFASALKLTIGGSRNTSITAAGVQGFYWSSTVSTNISSISNALNIYSGGAAITEYRRAEGMSVRCIKD